MSWHFHIFDKLAKVWRHLDFPDDGWRTAWPGSRRDQCTLVAVEAKARASSRASETTLRHWASCIHEHILDTANHQARAWLQEVEDRHKQASTADRTTLRRRPSGEALSITDVCAILRTGEPARTLGDQPAMKWGPWIWYEFLRDSYPTAEFDFVFHFGDGVRDQRQADSHGSPASISHAHAGDSRREVHKIWRPELSPPSHVRTQWPGHYILYRVDRDAFERSLKMPQKRWADQPHGWFGAQRVLRVPLSLRLNEDLIGWHDIFPDPVDGPFESRGLLAQSQDGTVDVFGYDEFTRNDDGKFLVTMLRTRRDDARGIIFAREADDKIVSCYRIWLHEIEPKAHEELVEEVRRVDAALRAHSSAEWKQREYRQNTTLFQTVAQLLAEHRYAMINYLFAPPGTRESDLAKRSKVKAIKPYPLSNVYFTANLQQR